MKNLVAGFVVLGLLVPFANAQEDWVLGGVEDGAITLTNDRGQDVPMLGIDIRSPSGGLKANGSGPFTITLLDTPNNVVVGNLGNAYILATDATVKTDITFAGDPNRLTGSWGNGTKPTPLLFSDPVDPASLPIGVSLDDDFRVVVDGQQQSLLGLEFESRSNSLVPGTADPSLFDVTSSNTPSNVGYGVSGSDPVVLDGSLTLPVGWNRLGAPDIRYYFRSPENELVGPSRLFTIPNSEDVRVTLSDTQNFVLNGSGQQLQKLDLVSTAGGLIPGSTSAPFTESTISTPQLIRYSAAAGNVAVDGQVTLTARWNRDVGDREIAYQYRELEAPKNAGPFLVDPATYPEPPVQSPVTVRLQRDAGSIYKFQLVGRGQELRTFQFDSASGSLLPATAADPFTSITENSPNRILFATAAVVRLDGTLTTSAGFDLLGQRDVTYRYQQIGIAEERGPFAVNNYPRLPAVDISVNDNFNFVVTGIGQTLNFLTLDSAGSSLVPSDDPGPFAALGRNTASQIEYQGGPVTIDGEVTLASKWNRVRGIRDVSFVHDTVQSSGVEFGAVSGYPPRAPTTPIQVEIDSKTLNFVLTGSGNELREFELTSPGQSLIPATTAGPFTSVMENTPSRIAYESSEFVTLDGSVVLSAAYNARVGNPAFYSYLEVGARSPTRRRQILEYPAFSDIQVSLDQDSRIVLQGQGERLLGIELISESGSLVPGASSAPFEVTLANTPQNVTYGVLGEAAAVVLDGTVTLSTAWNPLGQEDVVYTFGLSGGLVEAPIPLFRQLPQELTISVGLDANDRWTLKGSGQPLDQFNLFSPSGGLLPADTPAPFTELSENDTNAIRFVTNDQVTVDGELTLRAGWNRFNLQSDATYSFRIKGSDLEFGPLAVPGDVYPAVSLVGVDMTPDNHWILKGNGQQLEQFDLTSDSGGLVATDTPAPFAEVTQNDANAIRFVADGNVVLDGELTLGAGWNRNLGFRDVQYSYRQQGFDLTAGPYDVPNAVYPPEPPANRVLVSITLDDYKFVLTGNGHELRSFQFTSPSGTLIPAQSAGPFSSLTENTPSSVAFSSDSFVTLDGTLKTDVGYDAEVLGEDVNYQYDQVGFADPQGPFAVNRGQYPQYQQGDWILGGVEGGFLTLTNFHSDEVPMLGLDVTSTNGGLKAHGSGPFTILLLDTPNNVVVANLGEPYVVGVGATVKTEIAFDGDPSWLAATWGNGTVPSPISFSTPVVPEPTSGLLVCTAALGLLEFRRRRRNT